MLSVVYLFKEYKNLVFNSGSSIDRSNMVFCRFHFQSNSVDVLLCPHISLKQDRISRVMNNVVQCKSNLPEGITLHSFRRGGAHYRCFESEFKFTFKELMVCCRWKDTTTMCHYLVFKKTERGSKSHNAA